ncbi:MAG TPA: prepilin-type N-terminal cleavage/methylation domain-containing protein [Pseudonocardiaceae bacterium]|jgi:prepilin-type N-terminal cleavage/methylation domain-containing protein
MRLNTDEHGFTLIELIVAVAIITVITAPIGGVLVIYLRTSDATAARMTESNDAQLTAGYFARDVASVGVRQSASPYALRQSVDTSNSAAWPYPCAAAGTTPVVRFAWDDYPGGPGSATQLRVAYVLAGGGTKLRRLACAGSATPVSDVTVARDLDAATAPTVTCSTTCTAGAVPATVSLTLTIKDQRNRETAYSITLTGQRRQT